MAWTLQGWGGEVGGGGVGGQAAPTYLTTPPVDRCRAVSTTWQPCFPPAPVKSPLQVWKPLQKLLFLLPGSCCRLFKSTRRGRPVVVRIRWLWSQVWGEGRGGLGPWEAWGRSDLQLPCLPEGRASLSYSFIKSLVLILKFWVSHTFRLLLSLASIGVRRWKEV